MINYNVIFVITDTLTIIKVFVSHHYFYPQHPVVLDD